MRKQHKLNILAVSIAAGSSLLLAACGGGSSSSANGGGQSLTGASISAKNAVSLFSSNSCLSGSLSFKGSQWYASGSIDIKNTCNSEQTLSGQTISFTSQNTIGNLVSVGTLNNWWTNNTSYQLIFKAGNGNQQIGNITAANGNAIIGANQTIKFDGGFSLPGGAESHVFDNATAQSSFAINGASPTPTPTPGTFTVFV